MTDANFPQALKRWN